MSKNVKTCSNSNASNGNQDSKGSQGGPKGSGPSRDPFGPLWILVASDPVKTFTRLDIFDIF